MLNMLLLYVNIYSLQTNSSIFQVTEFSIWKRWLLGESLMVWKGFAGQMNHPTEEALKATGMEDINTTLAPQDPQSYNKVRHY